MRIIKYTHACVRLEHEGGVLVIDPGVWSEPTALTGADAVLVTHEHSDHIDVLRLAGAGVPVYAPADAQIDGVPTRPLQAGDEFTVAGLTVQAVGGRHAYAYADQPDCANLGYLVGGRIYHPGDALYVPEQRVQTLLVPVHAPWLKLGEAIDFMKTVAPERAYPVHDGLVNDRGLASINGWFDRETDGYRYLSPGEAATLE